MITHVGKKTTRGLILDVLSNEFPLSAKKIYNKIKKPGKSVTYHAIYDRISEMAKEGVLTKKGTEYMISPEWIEATGTVLDKIKASYLTATDEELKDIGKITSAMVLTFKTYRNLIIYRICFFDIG